MHVSERYIKLLRDREYRLEWAEKIAMGFELPGRSAGQQLAKTLRIGHFGQLIPFQKNRVSLLDSGGREGSRTPDLLVANEEKSKLRRGATIT
jgi:hypothetical protein